MYINRLLMFDIATSPHCHMRTNDHLHILKDPCSKSHSLTIGVKSSNGQFNVRALMSPWDWQQYELQSSTGHFGCYSPVSASVQVKKLEA